ncbi:hypothetical protein A6R68_04651, partial [Neotoma lepida]
MVYMFQYDSTHGKFPGIVTAENRNLSSMGRQSPSSSSRILTTSNGESGDKHRWSQRKAGAHLKMETKVIISASSTVAAVFVMGNEP